MEYLPGIGIGFALLAGSLVIGRFVGRRDLGSARVGIRRTALVFLPIWLLGVSTPMLNVRYRAGFSMRDDGPYYLIEYIVPASVALMIWWTLRPRSVPS